LLRKLEEKTERKKRNKKKKKEKKDKEKEVERKNPTSHILGKALRINAVVGK